MAGGLICPATEGVGCICPDPPPGPCALGPVGPPDVVAVGALPDGAAAGGFAAAAGGFAAGASGPDACALGGGGVLIVLSDVVSSSLRILSGNV